jgi:GT2 family glycosyltransferase
LVNEQGRLVNEKNRLTDENKILIQEKDELIHERNILTQTNNELIETSRIQISNMQNELDEAQRVNCELISRSNGLETALAAHQRAFWWRITKPIRVVSNGIKCVLKAIPGVRLLVKGLRSIRNNGVKVTLRKAKLYFNRRKKPKTNIQMNVFTERERKRQEKTKFFKKIKFSILVPLYNTPEKFLTELIESIQAQTYSNWELCMADGSGAELGKIEEICNELSKKDKRIVYKKIGKNLGISGNTNKCIEMATGEYIGLLDHDDMLHPAALYEVMQVIEKQNADFIYTDELTFDDDIQNPVRVHFKPEFAVDNLRAINYICHFSCFERKLLDKVGWFKSEYDGSQDHDLILRLTEQAEKIVRIPKLLYYWRAHDSSVAGDKGAEVKSYAIDAGMRAVQDHLKRCGLKGEVKHAVAQHVSIYKIDYDIKDSPLISIIIPNKDHIEELKKCIESILTLSTYTNYEIIVIENNSTEKETFNYYEQIKNNEKIDVYYRVGEFNYSKINNFGAKQANGDYLLLLNNDIEVITPDWLQEMLMYAQRKDVGAVGAKLYYPDETIQHGGVILGLGGIAGHAHKHFENDDPGYFGRLLYAQNLSAVTAACLMVSKSKFKKVGGLNEEFKVAFNDVDFCMKLRKAEYLNVFTPFAKLYHHESKSRGYEDTSEKQKRFDGEVNLFQRLWTEELIKGDPYYNPNLTIIREDFSYATAVDSDVLLVSERVNKLKAHRKSSKRGKFVIEFIKEQSNFVVIKGWAFVEDTDSLKSEIFVESFDTKGESGIFSAIKQNRQDVTEAYGSQLYLYSGYTAVIDLLEFDFDFERNDLKIYVLHNDEVKIFQGDK